MCPELVEGPAWFHLRELGPDDWELFRRVRLAALAEAPEAFGSRHADWVTAPPERWRARVADVPLNLVAIMVDSGEPVGMISATPPAHGTTEVISLWVAPSARGRGLADALVERVCTWARDQDLSRIVLSVRLANEPARRFYRRLGFVEVGPSADDPTELIMEHAL